MDQPGSTGGAEKEFAQAQAALAAEDTLTALSHLEKALKLRDHPGWYSYLGYCIARERGQHRKGVDLCRESLKAEPDQPAHFFNLGRVHLASGDKQEALRVLREGMARGESPELARLLERLGTRRPPVIPALSRSHLLNRCLGLILSRLGLR